MTQRRWTEEDKQIAWGLLKHCSVPRDELPYTEVFDQLRATFTDRTGRNLDPHSFWRLLCSAAKRGGLAKQRRPSGS